MNSETQARAISVLVVDDEPSVRMTLGANLELEGFEVTEAASGEEALCLFEKKHFDIVLSDIRMPGMHGVDLFRRVRAIRPNVPVVLMTAFAVEGLIRDAIDEGAFTVLPKPFAVEHAVAALTRAVEGTLVLVVDDVRQGAIAAAEALSSAGIKAEAAFSASEAVARVCAGNVDVCVVDLVMPETNGADLIAQIRALDRTIAIVAVSGFDAPELVRRVVSMGAITCMKKPFNVRELVGVISRARAKSMVASKPA